jgi:hypothetical protein
MLFSLRELPLRYNETMCFVMAGLRHLLVHRWLLCLLFEMVDIGGFGGRR